MTLLALVVKVGGNKYLLTLVGKQASWMVDVTLFNYEFSTATLLRFLQLSIPEPQVALLVSLFGDMAEVGVCIYFFSRFMQARLAHNHADMTTAEKLGYARWGKLRVADGTNDMIVEYVSSLTAAMFLIYLEPMGAFSFATNDVVEPSAVVELVLYQLVPELFFDLYVTFMEIQGGLKKVHEVVWSLSARGDLGSKLRAFRVGHFVKVLVVKSISAVIVVFFVLLSVAK